MLKRMIAEVDANKNGTIDLEEFYVFMAAKMANEDKEEQIRQAFVAFDGDGNGYISRSEMKKVSTKLSADCAIIVQFMKSIGEKLTSVELNDMMTEGKG